MPRPLASTCFLWWTVIGLVAYSDADRKLSCSVWPVQPGISQMQKLRSVTILWNHWSDSCWMYVLGAVLGRKPDKAASEREGGGAVGRRERCPPRTACSLPTSLPLNLPLSLPPFLPLNLPGQLALYLLSSMMDGRRFQNLQNLSLETNIILVVRWVKNFVFG